MGKDDFVSVKVMEATARERRWWASGLLFAILLFFVSAFTWAHLTEVDQIVNGVGKVIPSSRVQVVQHREGGIVKEILIRDGEEVEKNEVLLRIDATEAAAEFEKNQVQLTRHLAAIHRLEAEIDGVQPKFPEKVKKNHPVIVAEQMSLYLQRKSERENTIRTLESRLTEREKELSSAKAKINHLRRSYSLLQQEIKMSRPLVDSGAFSRVQLLRLEREAAELGGQIQETDEKIKQSRAAIQGAQQEINQKKDEFRRKALEERQELALKRDVLQQEINETRDRLKRTAIRSPVSGTVKRVLVNTEGCVVKPGMDLVEIVPAEDSLLVEARVKPEDIAFLLQDQPAKVRITAIDFAKYGAFDARLVYIGSDGEQDKDGNTFYRVHVRTDKNYLSGPEGKVHIKPGMQADVGIVTGENTVLSYLMKPILRAQDRAFREQ